jgi:hypothetical protein
MQATEMYLKLALRAQSQSRSTLEALSAIKYPPVANYVAQANVAHNQMVNNETSRTRENRNLQNELLEHKDGSDWLDTGEAGEASGNYPEMEAVGAVERAENG